MSKITKSPVLPGKTLGVLGSGQLGRMFALAARNLGYRIITYSPESATPAGQVCDLEIVKPYEDTDALRAFAQQVDVVTLEFENIPVEALEMVESITPVYPQPHVLYIAQHRGREKSFLKQSGFPVAPFCPIETRADLDIAIQKIGVPSILKTAGFGYDGKGQVTVNSSDEIGNAWQCLGEQKAILEQKINFQKEISVIAARGIDGAFVHYGAVENIHSNHILDISIAPAKISLSVQSLAVEMTQSLMEQLNMVGVLCVEFFLTPDERLLINEIAPRPHNSGHWTIDAAMTSQFEQQVRSICGLPLGNTEQKYPTAMANLLGDLWINGEPCWHALLGYSEVKLHLYGKQEARPGRKMGHLTAVALQTQSPEEIVKMARMALLQCQPSHA